MKGETRDRTRLKRHTPCFHLLTTLLPPDLALREGPLLQWPLFPASRDRDASPQACLNMVEQAVLRVTPHDSYGQGKENTSASQPPQTTLRPPFRNLLPHVNNTSSTTTPPSLLANQSLPSKYYLQSSKAPAHNLRGYLFLSLQFPWCRRRRISYEKYSSIGNSLSGTLRSAARFSTEDRITPIKLVFS
jgi:hypothetical protein